MAENTPNNRETSDELKKQSKFLSQIVNDLKDGSNGESIELDEKTVASLDNSSALSSLNDTILKQSKDELDTLSSINNFIGDVSKDIKDSFTFQKKLAADAALDKKEADAEAAKRAKEKDKMGGDVSTEDNSSDSILLALLGFNLAEKVNEWIAAIRESRFYKWISGGWKQGALGKLLKGEWITDIFSKLNSKLNSLKLNLNTRWILFTDNISNWFKNKLPNISNFFSNVSKSLNSIKLGIAGRWITYTTIISEWFSTTFPKLTKLFEKISTTIKGIRLSSITSRIGDILKGVLKIPQLLFKPIAIIGNMFSKLGGAGGVLTKIGEKVKTISKPLTNMFSSMKSIGALLGKIASVAGKIFAPITIIWGTINGLIDGFKAFENTEGNLGEKIWAGIREFTEGFLDVLIGWIPSVIGWITEKLGFTNLADIIREYDLANMVNPFSGLEKIWTFVSEFGELLSMWANNAIASVKLAFTSEDGPAKKILRDYIPDPTKSYDTTDIQYWLLKGIPDGVVDYAWGKKMKEQDLGLQLSRKQIKALAQESSDIKSDETLSKEEKEIALGNLKERQRLQKLINESRERESELFKARLDEMDDLFVNDEKVKQLEESESLELKIQRKYNDQLKALEKDAGKLLPPRVNTRDLSKPDSTTQAMTGETLTNSAASGGVVYQTINNVGGSTNNNTTQQISNNISESTDMVVSGQGMNL